MAISRDFHFQNQVDLILEMEFLKISDSDPYFVGSNIADLGPLEHALSPIEGPVLVCHTFVRILMAVL